MPRIVSPALSGQNLSRELHSLALKPLSRLEAEQAPPVGQYALDVERPPARSQEEARNPIVGEQVIASWAQRPAVRTRGVADGQMCVIPKGRRSERNTVHGRSLAAARGERRLAVDAQARVGEAGLVGYGAPQIDEEDLVAGHDGQRGDMVCWDNGIIWAYTGSGEGATSRNSTRKSCSSLGTLQKVALLLPGTPFSVVAIAVVWGSRKRACRREAEAGGLAAAKVEQMRMVRRIKNILFISCA